MVPHVGYEVKIIKRDGMGQTKDDYHATVTRLTDGHELIFISDWMWVMRRKTRRPSIERAFRRSDKRQLKLNRSHKFRV